MLRNAFAIACLVMIAATTADAKGGSGRGGGGGGGGGNRCANPEATFDKCLSKCLERTPGDAKDRNHCTKRCSKRVACPS